ncbi:CG8401, partial [Drosophila busckii]
YIISGGLHCSESNETTSESTTQLSQRVYGLLDKLSCGRTSLHASAKFALLLAEFLIKQKMRYVAPTRYDRQLYYHLLHRMEQLKLKLNINSHLSALEQQILDNAFQRNVLLLPPSLRYGALNANADYEALALKYERVVNSGEPNRTESDLCMRDIVTLNTKNCQLSLNCLRVLTSEAPAYGYQRTHQVLLLYMLQHHKCAPQLSPPMLYEQLGKSHCNEILREQNAIRSLALGLGKYRDLYLEQATICALYGFNEFLNWRNVLEIDSWYADESEHNEHVNDLALVFYINALLLLH